MDIRVSHFQDYIVKRNGNDEVDLYDAMIGQLAIDSLQISWYIYQFRKGQIESVSK